MSDQPISLEFTPSDFFYLNAKDSMPSDYRCGEYRKYPPNCEEDIQSCYKSELCKNKELVDKVYLLQNKHGGSDGKLVDIQTKYIERMVQSFNLGMASIGIIVYIYYNIGE
jgi:hypothetical protein